MKMHFSKEKVLQCLLIKSVLITTLPASSSVDLAVMNLNVHHTHKPGGDGNTNDLRLHAVINL